MTIDTDKTLELLHNSPCSFSYNTNPSRYTIEQKELVKFVNFIYNKVIDDAKSVILQTIDNEILVDTLHLRLEHLKERNNE